MPDGDGDTRDPEPGGDFDAEVSDTRPAAPARSRALRGRGPVAPPAPFAARRTPSQRLLRQAYIAATVLLALAIVMEGFPALRDRTLGLVLPAPAPTIAPGSDLFTLLPNPPGVTVSLDGRPLAHPPAPGDPHPLRLAPGHHTFAWQSRLYPFAPQSCTVSVPAGLDDTCAFVPADTLIAQDVLTHSNVLATHASLFTVQVDDIVALQQAIGLALAASAASATVQPGEPYYTLSDSGADASAVATQPLHATLRFTFNPVVGNTDPCVLRQPDLLCRFQGQNCQALCTIPDPPPRITAGNPNAWIVAAAVGATWTYTTPDGHTLGPYPNAGADIQLMVLRITWDGAAWHVTPFLGHTPGLDATDGIACDPARYWLANSTWTFMLDNPPPSAQARFYSDANPADGCLVVMDRGQPASSTARFLGRFGLLFTLDDNARNPVDNFPQADAAAQAQARAIAANDGVNL